MTTETIEDTAWFELEQTESYQERAWQNRVDGKVLSLEPVGSQTYDVVTLPENFKDDNQVIDVIAHEVSIELAEESVKTYVGGEI